MVICGFRRDLHRRPEVSGEERETADTIVKALRETKPDAVITGLGGHGVAAIYEGREPGPTVMVRAWLRRWIFAVAPLKSSVETCLSGTFACWFCDEYT